MSSESGHVPRLDDRRVALGSASYIDRAAAGLLDEIQLNPEGLIVKHANDGLSQAKCLLTVVASQGLVQAIGTGVLARWRSEYSAAHGADGVMKTTQSYVDVLDVLKEVLEP